jgi:hypothetical protein
MSPHRNKGMREDRTKLLSPFPPLGWWNPRGDKNVLFISEEKIVR